MFSKFKDFRNSLNQIHLEYGRKPYIWKQKSRSNHIFRPITASKNGVGITAKSGIKQLFSKNIADLQELLHSTYASFNFPTYLTRRLVQVQTAARRRQLLDKEKCYYNKQNYLEKRTYSNFSRGKNTIEKQKSNKIITDESYLNQLKSNIENVLEKQIQQINELQSRRVRKDIKSAVPLQNMVVEKIRAGNKPERNPKLNSGLPVKIRHEKHKEISCTKSVNNVQNVKSVAPISIIAIRKGSKNEQHVILDNFRVKYINEPNNKTYDGSNSLPKNRTLIRSNNNKENKKVLNSGNKAIPASLNSEFKFSPKHQSINKSSPQTKPEVKDLDLKDPTNLSIETINSLREKMGIEPQTEKIGSKKYILEKMNKILEEINSEKAVQQNLHSEKKTDPAHQTFSTKRFSKENTQNSESLQFKPLLKTLAKVNTKKSISNNSKTVENVVYKHETYLPTSSKKNNGSPDIKNGNNVKMPLELRHFREPLPDKSKIQFSHKSVSLRDVEMYRKFRAWDREKRLRTIYNTHWDNKTPKGFVRIQVNVPNASLSGSNRTKPLLKPVQEVKVHKLNASSLAESIRQRAKIINKNRIKDEVLQPQIYCRKSAALGLAQLPILPCKNMLQKDVTDHLIKKRRAFSMNIGVRKPSIGSKLYKESQKKSRPLWKRQKMISSNEGVSTRGILSHGKNRGIVKKRKLDFKGTLKYIMNLKSRLQSQ